MKKGFDNAKYLQMQSQHIRERIAQFDNKLYLEFGGKLFDDYHASRVLPGFEPDSKLQVLGLPGAEDVTDGSVDYYDMDWENVENGVTEEQMAKCIAKECACTPHCKCSGNLPDQSDDEAYEMTLEG